MENARQFDVNLYRRVGGRRGAAGGASAARSALAVWVKVRERPREPERLAEMVTRERNFIAPLGILALDLSDPRLAALAGLAAGARRRGGGGGPRRRAPWEDTLQAGRRHLRPGRPVRHGHRRPARRARRHERQAVGHPAGRARRRPALRRRTAGVGPDMGLSTSATRTRRAPDRDRRLLEAAQVIESPETRLRYRIDRLLGAGGFGQAYLARRLGYSSHVPEVVCVKASRSIDGWLREAYFGQVLDGHPRAIRVYDVFPLMTPQGRALLPGPRVREPGRPARVPPPLGHGLAGDHGAARDRRHPAGARQAAPRPDAAPRPHADERVRVRPPLPEARRLRHRAPAERPARARTTAR